MTAEELQRTWTAYRERRCIADRNALVEHYLPWVRTVVYWLFTSTDEVLPVDRADLISHGVVGLLQGIDRFDPEQLTRFETFCLPRVKGAVLDALRALDWIPKGSRAALKQRGQIRPSIYRLRRRGNTSAWLIDPRTPEPSVGLETREVLAELTKGLNRTERLVLILYYYEGLKMREIGEQIGLSQARVSQIHDSVLHRLRCRSKRLNCPT